MGPPLDKLIVYAPLISLTWRYFQEAVNFVVSVIFIARMCRVILKRHDVFVVCSWFGPTIAVRFEIC